MRIKFTSGNISTVFGKTQLDIKATYMPEEKEKYYKAVFLT